MAIEELLAGMNQYGGGASAGGASPFPVGAPAPTVGPTVDAAAGMPATTSAGGGMFADGKIFGMTPEKFATIFGGMAASIGGPKTIGGRLGAIASQMGAAQLQAMAAKNQLSGYSKFASELLSNMSPEQARRIGTLAGQFKHPETPDDMYKPDQSGSVSA